jgi:hypothetical protein
MIERQREICEKITHFKLKLKAPLMEINAIEVQLTDLYSQEKILREKYRVEEGKRILDDVDTICLKECESNINRCIRQKAKIEKEHKEDFDKLKNNLEEEKRLRDKDKVYKVDVELDQIMTCFKMTFVNLCSFFLIKCFDREKFELLTLMESIFQLDGSASVSDDRKVIDLEMNPKEPDLMCVVPNVLALYRFVLFVNSSIYILFNLHPPKKDIQFTSLWKPCPECVLWCL